MRGRIAQKIRAVARNSGVQSIVGADVEIAGLGAEAIHGAHQRLAEQLPILRAIARGLCRDAAEAEDLVQDAFDGALRAIDLFDPEVSPRGWMVTILHRRYLDRCRARMAQRPADARGGLARTAPDDGLAWAAISADDVRRAAVRLPAELRDAYLLFAFEGRTYGEIAEALDIPKTAVAARILRARAQLKKLLASRVAEDP